MSSNNYVTIKDLREILKHFTDYEYDDWKVCLWDFNNQREVEMVPGMHSVSRPDKQISFPVRVEPIDGEEIDRRLARMIKEVQNSNNNNNEQQESSSKS